MATPERAPIQPASRTHDITYAVRDIVVLAREVARGGRELLYLNIGDPNQFDFETPAHLVEAVHRAMCDNHNGYSASEGIPDAVEAIRRQAARSGITGVRDIFVSTGASEAIEIALTALAEPGDNILTPSPGYPLYTAVLSKLGVHNNPYYLDEANGWQPDLDDLAHKINARTRAIVIINPNNPTGSVATRETLQGLAKLAIERNLVVFSDEIYDKLILGDAQHVSIASLNPDLCCLTFNGLSKSYLAPGFRIGWSISSGPEKQLRPFIDAMQKITRARLCANHPMQFAIAPALDGDQSHLVEVKRKLTARRDLTVRMLNEIPGVSCVKPRGAFYAFPRIELGVEDKPFVEDMLRATGVVCVHGSGFGQKPGTAHFRIVFLPPEDVLTRSYQAMATFVASCPPRA
ncbi:MAG: aminotransferase class I/II-fold pyridoxal phosphate-dependent enzyme [Pseudomonadota bacterium]